MFVISHFRPNLQFYLKMFQTFKENPYNANASTKGNGKSMEQKCLSQF